MSLSHAGTSAAATGGTVLHFDASDAAEQGGEVRSGSKEPPAATDDNRGFLVSEALLLSLMHFYWLSCSSHATESPEP